MLTITIDSLSFTARDNANKPIMEEDALLRPVVTLNFKRYIGGVWVDVQETQTADANGYCTFGSMQIPQANITYITAYKGNNYTGSFNLQGESGQTGRLNYVSVASSANYGYANAGTPGSISGSFKSLFSLSDGTNTYQGECILSLAAEGDFGPDSGEGVLSGSGYIDLDNSTFAFNGTVTQGWASGTWIVSGAALSEIGTNSFNITVAFTSEAYWLNCSGTGQGTLEADNIAGSGPHITVIENGYILIYNEKDLRSVDNDVTANYRLMVDLTLSDEYSATPLGVEQFRDGNYFSGIFDGNSHKISGLKSALFVVLGQASIVHDLSLLLVNIDQTSQYAAALAMGAIGTISNVHASGTITTSYVAAGLVQMAVPPCHITQCSFRGTITCQRGGGCGGLVGQINFMGGPVENQYCLIEKSLFCGSMVSNNCGGIVAVGVAVHISNCYAMGTMEPEDVENEANFGLIMMQADESAIEKTYAALAQTVGDNRGFIVAATNTTASDCHYDMELAPLLPAFEGVEANSTTNMKLQGTYVNWDFIEIWRIDPNINDGYPFLWFEISSVESGNVKFSVFSKVNGVFVRVTSTFIRMNGAIVGIEDAVIKLPQA